LKIQPPLDVRQLCERLAELRGRPIRLLAQKIPANGPFGVWLAGKDADVIVYQEQTTPSHQDHIILHELGHMLAEHPSDEADDELLRQLYPDEQPDSIRHALRRPGYDDQHEREAENVATLILQWASVANNVPRRIGDTTPVGRYDDALADRIGWL
jgi:Zn-dependent peptidase ImmA (M78 family)